MIYSSCSVPNAAEPYLTIARIYEDQNDHEKAFEVRWKMLHFFMKKILL